MLEFILSNLNHVSIQLASVPIGIAALLWHIPLLIWPDSMYYDLTRGIAQGHVLAMFLTIMIGNLLMLIGI